MKSEKLIYWLKSNSPIAKRSNLDAARRQIADLMREVDEYKQHITDLKHHVAKLDKISEEWAREVRGARLEIQRHKEYPKWLEQNYPTTETILDQKKNLKLFTYKPCISIIVPAYNTEPEHLRACIRSVLAQSYEDWQLCIVDDASTNPLTIKCLREFAGLDSRIQIKRSSENGHISVASNNAIEMAKGEFIALLDHDDFLWPNALFEVVKMLQNHRDADLIYSDEDRIEASGNVHYWPFFKPDWSPHLLECVNYITHFSVLRTSIVRKVGGFEKDLVGAQDWDLFLRVTEKTQKVFHIPTILYSWRAHQQSTALSMEAKDYAAESQRKTIKNHFSRVSEHAVKIVSGPHASIWYAKYELENLPLVSIIIPTKDKSEYLRRCIDSITSKTLYGAYEIIIVDTGSNEDITKKYYQYLKETFSSDKLRIKLYSAKPFNYSAANNFGAKYAKGNYLLMLNNDTEVITETWLEDLLGYAQLREAGAIGVKLLFPNKQIQHAGVTLGVGGSIPGKGGGPVATHPGMTMDYSSEDFFQALYTNTVRDVAAVTAACLMVSREKFNDVGGFDTSFRITYNDVDFCLRLRDKGYQNIYIPFVELFHHESVSVGKSSTKARNRNELYSSGKLLRKKWKRYIQRDEFYNPNFDDLSVNFGLAVHKDTDQQSAQTKP